MMTQWLSTSRNTFTTFLQSHVADIHPFFTIIRKELIAVVDMHLENLSKFAEVENIIDAIIKGEKSNDYR